MHTCVHSRTRNKRNDHRHAHSHPRKKRGTAARSTLVVVIQKEGHLLLDCWWTWIAMDTVLCFVAQCTSKSCWFMQFPIPIPSMLASTRAALHPIISSWKRGRDRNVVGVWRWIDGCRSGNSFINSLFTLGELDGFWSFRVTSSGRKWPLQVRHH